MAVEVEDGKRDQRGRRITPAARRAELVEGYRASGQTMEQYAKLEGIKRHTLAKWVFLHDQRSRAVESASSGTSGRSGGGFAQVNVVAAARPSWAYELTLPNGWVVRAADAMAVAQLLGAVHA